jgi:hypothetical protein
LGTRRVSANAPNGWQGKQRLTAKQTTGACKISQSQRAHNAELHLLFAKGKRPDRHEVKAFAGRLPAVSVSHDPVEGDASHSQGAKQEGIWPGQLQWVELLRDGLTFDLSGLAPGPADALAAFAHRFDLPALPSPEEYEAIVLRPGPHLAEGAGSLPVMRELLALGCDIVRQFDEVLAVGWGPAGAAIGRRFFESTTSAWLDGGPFPALGLTAFTETPDAALESVGLAFWIGQELRIEPPLSADRVAATRLGIRLVNHLVLTGGLAEDDRIVAPDGARLVLRPSRSLALISVWRE